MADGRIDWPGIAEEVVFRLLGEPNRRLSRGPLWRYGSKGSLSIDLDMAVWKDFEQDEGGGISKLVERQIGGDWKAARRWLEDQGLIERWKPARGRANGAVGRRAGRGRGGSGGPARGSAVRRPVGASRGDPESGRGGEGKDRWRIACAAALWAATVEVETAGSPVVRYLNRRGVWPAPATWRRGWWPAIPGAVRWADRAALVRADRGLLFGDEERPFPDDAAGAMVFAYRPALGGDVKAVSVEALTAEGERCGEGGRWRKSRGVFGGAVAALPAVADGARIALVEGEADGLACVLLAHANLHGLGDVGEVRVVAGTSGMKQGKADDAAGRPVLLLPDGPGADGSGSAAGAAGRCAAALRRAGRRVSVRIRDEGDVADDLALMLMERSERIERDSGYDDDDEITRSVALSMAWQSILNGEGERR